MKDIFRVRRMWRPRGELKRRYEVVVVGGGSHGLATAYYLAKRHGIRDVCMAANCFMIDLWHGLGTHGDDRSGYYFDGLHPNDRGHAAWADYIARWMLEAIQADASPSSLSSAG